MRFLPFSGISLILNASSVWPKSLWGAAAVKKDRDIYNLDKFIITLDTVYDVGTFVEIETEAQENEDTSGSIDKIFEIYKKLGIEDGFERRSYLELQNITI